MTLIEWKSSFALGIPAVDEEHRELIGMINEVYAQLGDRRDTQAIEDALGEIHAGIAAHFALEEQMMRRTGWHEYGQHKANHEELLERIRELMDGFAADPESGRLRLQRELADWFTVHFASFDARLHEAFPPPQRR